MRIRRPGRFIALVVILSALLCLLPANSRVAVAYPIGWINMGPTDPNATGDNDGVVLKSMTAASPTVAATGTGDVVAPSTVRHELSGLRMFLAVLRLNWSFWQR